MEFFHRGISGYFIYTDAGQEMDGGPGTGYAAGVAGLDAGIGSTEAA